MVAKNAVSTRFSRRWYCGASTSHHGSIIPAALVAACDAAEYGSPECIPSPGAPLPTWGSSPVWVWLPVRFLVPMLPVFLWHVLVATRRLPVITLGGCRHGSYRDVVRDRSLDTVTHAHPPGVSCGCEQSPGRIGIDSPPYSTGFVEETPPDAVLTGISTRLTFSTPAGKPDRAFVADPYALSDSANHTDNWTAWFGQRLPASPPGRWSGLLCVESCAKFISTPHFRRLLDQLSQDVPGSLTIATGDVAAGYVVYRIDQQARPC